MKFSTTEKDFAHNDWTNQAGFYNGSPLLWNWLCRQQQELALLVTCPSFAAMAEPIEVSTSKRQGIMASAMTIVLVRNLFKKFFIFSPSGCFRFSRLSGRMALKFCRTVRLVCFSLPPSLYYYVGVILTQVFPG